MDVPASPSNGTVWRHPNSPRIMSRTALSIQLNLLLTRDRTLDAAEKEIMLKPRERLHITTDAGADAIKAVADAGQLSPRLPVSFFWLMTKSNRPLGRDCLDRGSDGRKCQLGFRPG